MKKSEENAYSTKFKELTELKNFIGKELGLTSWMQMSQKKINDFAEITDDKQWIHTDPEKSALYSPYKKTVAHGFLVLSNKKVKGSVIANSKHKSCLKRDEMWIGLIKELIPSTNVRLKMFEPKMLPKAN